MKMTVKFEMSGIDYTMAATQYVGGTTFGLDHVIYETTLESRPGEMESYVREVAKVFPDLMACITEACKISAPTNETEPKEEEKPSCTSYKEVEEEDEVESSSDK